MAQTRSGPVTRGSPTRQTRPLAQKSPLWRAAVAYDRRGGIAGSSRPGAAHPGLIRLVNAPSGTAPPQYPTA